MKRRVHRREFLRSSALLGAGVTFVGPGILGAGQSPNEKLNIAIIGAGGRGESNTGDVADENIVAICDINERILERVGEKFPKAQKYLDWRKCLEQKDVEAVVCSTTDHTHAFINVWAMNRGKHVYCEKPLANSVHEARTVRETYLKNKGKIATQMGTQIHASENYRRVVELVQSGAIGPVREAHAWVEQGIDGPRSRPAESQPVPEGLHWDLWLGPAPVRPYHSCYLERRSITWQNWWDFGNGALGDMGSHIIDLPFWALELQAPTTVEAEGPLPVRAETYPDYLTVRWEHPARGKRPAVKLTWYDGKQRPKAPAGLDLKKWHLGVMFIGDKGILVADYGKWVLLPEADFKGFQPPKPWLPKSLGHHEEWLHACKTGAPTLCNFDYSGALVEHNLLGTVAFRVGKKLEWDPVNLKARNCPEADQFIQSRYRDGWAI